MTEKPDLSPLELGPVTTKTQGKFFEFSGKLADIIKTQSNYYSLLDQDKRSFEGHREIETEADLFESVELILCLPEPIRNS